MEAARRRRGGYAFTLIEAVVALVVLGILLGIAGVAYSSATRHQEDQAGKPLLGTAQSEARRVAASNGYTFPSDLPTRLGQRTAVIDGAGTQKVTYTAAASYAPKTTSNTSVSYQISTAAAGPLAVFAVETTAGHCWSMADRTNTAVAGTGDVTTATTWGYAENVPPGECKAALLIDCVGVKVAGSSADPSDLAAPCASTAATASLSEVRCNVAEPAGPTSAALTWTAPADMTGIAGYRVYAWKDVSDQSTLAPTIDSSTGDVTLNASLVQPARMSPPMSPTATSATVTGLAAGSTYVFAVVPEDGAGRIDQASLDKLRSRQLSLPELRVVPGAPASVTATGFVDRIEVTFSSVPGATTYTVSRAPAGSPDETVLDTVSANDPQPGTYTVTDSAPAPGLLYDYSVRAANPALTTDICGVKKTSGGIGGGGDAPTPVGVTLAAPDLKADKFDLNDGDFADDVQLTWEPVDGAEGYRVYRDGSLLAQVGDVSSYDDLDRVHGAMHQYTLVAFAGALTSPSSNQAKVTIDIDAPVLNTTVFVNDGDNRKNDVRLTWTGVPNASGYEAYSCTDATCATRTLLAGGAVGSATTTVAHLNGTEGATYWYQVDATPVNSGPPVTHSNVSTQTLVLGTPVLTASKIDANSDGNINDVRLTWTAVPGATQYILRHGTVSGTTTTVLTAANFTGTSFTDLNRAAGSTNYYRVEARNALTGRQSNQVRVDMALDAPDLTATTTAADADGYANDLRLTWPAVTGTGITYELYRSGSATPFVTGLTALTYTDKDRAWGQTHCYTAKARNSAGTYSAMSDPACDDVLLRAPAITATDSAQNAIVTWPAVPGATGYKLYRDPVVSSGTITGGTLIATLGAVGTYTDPARPWGSSTRYALVATRSGATDSPASNVATAVIVPAAPTTTVSLAYNTRMENRIPITFPSGATTINLYRNGAFLRSFAKSTTAAGYVYPDAVARGTAYRYKMTASNVSGASAASAEDTGYVPPAAADVTQVSVSGSTLTVKFTTPVGADKSARGYRSYRYYMYLNGVSRDLGMIREGTSNTEYVGLNPGQSYLVQIFPYDANSYWGVPTGVYTATAPFTKSNGDSGDNIDVYLYQTDWYFPDGWTSFGSSVVNNRVSYGIDLRAWSPKPTRTYDGYKEVSTAQRQVGWNRYTAPTGLNGVTGSNVPTNDARRLARALGIYGATRNDATAAAMNNVVRVYTVQGDAATTESNWRWGRQKAGERGSEVAAAYNSIIADANHEGPFVAKVTYLSQPNNGSTTKVRLEVLDDDGKRVPNSTVAVTFNRALSPGLQNTGSAGYKDISIKTFGTGTMTATVYATDTPETSLRLAMPNDYRAERQVMAGVMQKSAAKSYSITVAP